MTTRKVTDANGRKHITNEPLLHPPPTATQQERKPLTDEEIDDLSRMMVKGNKSVNWLCRAIEAKLKEKND